MLIFIDDIEVTKEELKRKLDGLKEAEVLELVEVDEYGNLHFEENVYGLYY